MEMNLKQILNKLKLDTVELGMTMGANVAIITNPCGKHRDFTGELCPVCLMEEYENIGIHHF